MRFKRSPFTFLTTGKTSQQQKYGLLRCDHTQKGHCAAVQLGQYNGQFKEGLVWESALLHNLNNVFDRCRSQDVDPVPRSSAFWLQTECSILGSPSAAPASPETATPFPSSTELRSLNSYRCGCFTRAKFFCLLDEVIALLESLLFSSMTNKLRAVLV